MAGCVGFVGVMGAARWHINSAAAGLVFDEPDVPARPTGIVFGARATVDGPGESLTARLDIAVRLYRERKVANLLVSGNGDRFANDEPQTMADYLEAAGIPAVDIAQDTQGYDTYATCVRASEVFGVESAVLITQMYHVNRAVTTCNAVGVDVVGVGDQTISQTNPEVYSRAEAREWPAALKMEWELLTRPEVGM